MFFSSFLLINSKECVSLFIIVPNWFWSSIMFITINYVYTHTIYIRYGQLTIYFQMTTKFCDIIIDYESKFKMFPFMFCDIIIDKQVRLLIW